jgi:hypothetical protein
VTLTATVIGAWWAITDRSPRRTFGLVGAVVGGVLIVVGVIRAEPHGDRPVVALAVAAALLLGTVGFARAAIARDLHERDDRRPLTVTRPRRPVLICNPWSGAAKWRDSDSPTWPSASASKWSCSITGSTSRLTNRPSPLLPS